MKKLFYLLLLASSFGFSQNIEWENSANGNFIIDSVNLGPNGDLSTVSVSGKAGNWTVYMTYYFTFKYDLKLLK